LKSRNPGRQDLLGGIHTWPALKSGGEVNLDSGKIWAWGGSGRHLILGVQSVFPQENPAGQTKLQAFGSCQPERSVSWPNLARREI